MKRALSLLSLTVVLVLTPIIAFASPLSNTNERIFSDIFPSITNKPSHPQVNVPHKTIVVLFPNQSDLPQTRVAEQTFRENFSEEQWLDIDVFYEYLYLNRFNDEANQQNEAKLINERYMTKHVDLFIILNESGLNFWMKYQQPLFADTPVILFDITPEVIARYELPINMTVINSFQDFRPSLEWYLQARPDTDQVINIHGVGPADLEFLQNDFDLRSALNDSVELVDWSDLPLAEIQRKASDLPSTSVILYQLMFEDADGVAHRPIDVVREISEVSSVPVISGYDQFIGTGSIGGSLYSIEAQSLEAVDLSIHILHGDDMGAFRNTTVPNQFIFDHTALRRWGIPLSSLPQGSLIRNRQYTYWETNQRSIIAVSAGVITLIIFIIFLSLALKRLNTARNALKQLNTDLEDQVKERTVALKEANIALEADIAERALAEAERLRLLTILESTSNEIYIFYPNSLKFEFANQTALHNLGLTMDEIKKMTTVEVTTQLSTAEFRERISPLLSGEKQKILIKTIHTRADLTSYNVEAHLQKVDYNGEDHILAIISDISKRDYAEAALRESYQIAQDVINVATEAVYLIDINGTVKMANLMTAHRFGQSLEQLVGGNIYDVDPEAKRINKSWFDTAIEEKRSLQFEAEVGGRWIQNNVYPIFNADNNVTQLAIFGMDITNLKVVEEKLKLTNEKLTSTVNELKRNNENTVIIQSMDDLLQRVNTIDEAYQIYQQFCQRLFPNTAGAIFLFDPKRTILEAFSVWGEDLKSELVFQPEQCWTLRLGHTFKAHKNGTSLRCLHMPADFKGDYLSVPLIATGELIGTLHIENQGEHWNANNIEKLATTIAEHIGLALSNIRLREKLRSQSIEDPLTHLYNRRFMNESLEREVRRANRYQTTVGVMMLDIDHFKRVNDQYGHEAGDTVLRELGVLLKNNLRGEDIACRYGGEEFVLILPNMPFEKVKERAEQIRQQARSIRIKEHWGGIDSVAVSIGIAEYPTHGATGLEVVKKADDALYRAKQNGRDRVETAS